MARFIVHLYSYPLSSQVDEQAIKQLPFVFFVSRNIGSCDGSKHYRILLGDVHATGELRVSNQMDVEVSMSENYSICLSDG